MLGRKTQEKTNIPETGREHGVDVWDAAIVRWCLLLSEALIVTEEGLNPITMDVETVLSSCVLTFLVE